MFAPSGTAGRTAAPAVTAPAAEVKRSSGSVGESKETKRPLTAQQQLLAGRPGVAADVPDVEDGVFSVLLIGKTGAGKSTIVNM